MLGLNSSTIMETRIPQESIIYYRLRTCKFELLLTKFKYTQKHSQDFIFLSKESTLPTSLLKFIFYVNN